MTKTKWKVVALILPLIASFTCILILWFQKEWALGFQNNKGGYYYGDNLDEKLLYLGKERQGLVNYYDRNLGEFLRFEFMQDIRAAGFEPLWKGDRYIFKGIESGQESDPFRLHPDKNMGGADEIDLDIPETDQIMEPGSSDLPNDADVILSEIYYHQVMGYHLVVRGYRFLYVRNVLPTDMEITFEQLFLRDIAVSYNAYAQRVDLCFVERNEVLLDNRGLIVKKDEGGYIPVCLETGAVPELPPKEFFVSYAWDVVNSGFCLSDSGGDYFARRRLSEVPHRAAQAYGEEYSSCVAAKETLDLYGVKIRWNPKNKNYEPEETK
jgi:hypothetical protein